MLVSLSLKRYSKVDLLIVIDFDIINLIVIVIVDVIIRKDFKE